MNNTMKELAHWIEKEGGKIADISNGYDREFSKADMKNLPSNKYVLPYVNFSSDRDTFLKIGEKCIQFNSESKDKQEFIFWKVIVYELDKHNFLFCLSATINRMDLHDSDVVTGLTNEKRTELLNASQLLLSDFNKFLRMNI